MHRDEISLYFYDKVVDKLPDGYTNAQLVQGGREMIFKAFDHIAITTTYDNADYLLDQIGKHEEFAEGELDFLIEAYKLGFRG